jgi:hypothetical protein
MIDNLKKWKPILDNFFTPYELEQEILEMVAEYVENSLEVSPYSTLQGNGFGPVVPPNIVSPGKPGKTQQEVMEVLREFKERLTKDVDIRVNIKNTYYNSTIKRIVYELENGDSVYLEGKPLIMKDSDYIKKSKKLFLTISDPTNPQVRKMKIEDIRSKI